MLLKLRTESTNYICFLNLLKPIMLIFLAFARVHLIVIWMSWSTTFRFGLKLCCPTWEYSYLCGPQLTAVWISTFAFCTRMFLANTKLVQFNEPFVIEPCVVNLWLIIAVTHNLSSCEITAWNNSVLNGIRTQDLCDTGAVLYRLSYQATGSWSLCELVISRRMWRMQINIWKIIILNCGERYAYVLCTCFVFQLWCFSLSGSLYVGKYNTSYSHRTNKI